MGKFYAWSIVAWMGGVLIGVATIGESWATMIAGATASIIAFLVIYKNEPEE